MVLYFTSIIDSCCQVSIQASVFLDPREVVGNLGVNARHLPGTGGGPERDDADDHPGVVRVEMQQRAPTVSPTSIRLENSKLEKQNLFSQSVNKRMLLMMTM